MISELPRICLYVFFALTLLTVALFLVGLYLEHKKNRGIGF